MMMKQFLKWILRILIFLAVAAVGAYYWFFQPSYVAMPALTGVFETYSIAHGGVNRTYAIYSPKNLTGTPDLIFVLHGSRSNGSEIRKQTAYEFDVIADTSNLVVVYPDGYENHWNDCRASGNYAANLENIDDISFLKVVEQEIKTRDSLEFADIFAVGLSNGGHMAFKLGMEAPRWVTGIAAIAASFPDADNLDCKEQRKPVAVLVMNGTKDPINPYNGGEINFLGMGKRGRVISTDATIDYWKTLNRQKTEPIIAPITDKIKEDASTVATHFWRTKGRKPIALYTINGGGHTIPHPRNRLPRLLGATNKDIHAAIEIWKFFQSTK